MAVGGEPDAHRDRHLEGVPDAARHAPADQIAAVAHRARRGVALLPAEGLGALAVAFAQGLAAVGPAVVLVAFGIAAQAELERVDLQRDGQLVHRGFQRIDGGRRTGAAHVAGCGKIELGEPVGVFRVGRGVEQAGPAGLLPKVILVLRGQGHRIMGDRIQGSVGLRAQRNALDHRRAVAQHIHLLPGQHDAHGSPQRARRERREHRLELRAQGHAEGAAHEGRHDAQLVRLQAEHAAEIALHVLHALGLVVDREPAVLLDDRRGGKELHRVVVLDRRRVFALVAHGSGGERRAGSRRAASAG